MRQSIPRLRRVRFKDGATLEILRTEADKGEDWARRLIDRVLRAHLEEHSIAGMVLVVWSPGLDVTVEMMATPASPVSHLLIPEMVRAHLQRRLTALQIGEALDAVFHGPPRGA